MLRNRRSALVVAGVVAVGLAVGGLPGSAQAADAAIEAVAAVQLPLTNPADVAAANGRVFVSGGTGSTEVTVADSAGTVVGALSNLPGPTDLLVSDDLRTLYVALPNVNAIAVFDTRSLRESARYATGVGECPSSLALTGRFLWFGYGCDQWGGNIGRVDLGARPATVETGLSAQNYHDHPLLSAASRNRDVLLATQPSLSPTSAHAYSVGRDGALTFLREDDHTLGGNLRDAALDPTGQRVYLAAGWPYQIDEYAFADLTVRTRAFPTGPYPNAVEPSRDGAYLAAGIDGSYEPDVLLFTADGTQLGVIELGQRLIDRGLAWASDGRRLYAVSADSYTSTGRPATLHVLQRSAGGS